MMTTSKKEAKLSSSCKPSVCRTTFVLHISLRRRQDLLLSSDLDLRRTTDATPQVTSIGIGIDVFTKFGLISDIPATPLSLYDVPVQSQP